MDANDDRSAMHHGRPDSGGTTALLEVMVEFRAARTARALLDEAPEAISRLGFDRVLISRVNEGIWMPESMFVRRNPRWALEIMQAGQDEPTTVDSVVETDVVETASTLVVDDVQSHPRVCRPIARISRSENYGVAPIVLDDAVIGMVHADCFLQGRDVHRDECTALAAVSETLGAHLNRLLLLEHLEALRQAGAGALWAGAAPAGHRAVPDVSGPPRDRSAIGQPAKLTERERDVIELMAQGETNYGIARHLHITEGTAKTHVSNILHKLGASNRAQAVSRWSGR
ncbi:MAG TPA: LuxR C-terminal-related transcriptional regulator [Pseudonocardia sp.]|jgi:DNA-binding CsgD family transcriptional regulator|nr:LuxR C-terminal-related transcriptional regulator [Pseudonocardia sp.]